MCNMWSVCGKSIYTKCQASSTISHIHNLPIAHQLLIAFINGCVVKSYVMVDGGSIPTEIQPHHMLDELFPLLLMILVEIHCSIKCTCHILKGKKHNLHTFNLTCNWMHCAIRNGFRKGPKALQHHQTPSSYSKYVILLCSCISKCLH